MLTGLRHRAIGCSNNQDSAVHLSSTGDHVLDVVSVTRAVNVSIVARLGIIFNVRGVDGDTTLTLFRRLVDLIESESLTAVSLGQHGCDGGSQGGLTVVNVADSTYVKVGFCTFKLFFRHARPSNYL